MPKYDIDFEITASGRVTVEADNRDNAVTHLNQNARMIIQQNLLDLQIDRVEVNNIVDPEGLRNA